MITLRPSTLSLSTFAFALGLTLACSDDQKSSDTNDTSTTSPGDGDPGDGDPACTPGELNCDCNSGQCLGDLECVDGTCVADCIPGELACECNNGQCLGGLECVNDMCTDPNCTPGELGCECNNGQCLGDLECVANLCSEPGGDGDPGDGDPGDGDPGDGDGDPNPCPNPGEMMCNGQCIDVLADDDNCGACDNVCKTLGDEMPPLGACTDGACTPVFADCLSNQQGQGLNCNDICGMTGDSCVAQGCAGQTIVLSLDQNNCNNGGGSNYFNFDCNVQFGWQGNPFAGCCCTQ